MQYSYSHKFDLSHRGFEFEVLVEYNFAYERQTLTDPASVDIEFGNMLNPETLKPISDRLYNALIGSHDGNICDIIEENHL